MLERHVRGLCDESVFRHAGVLGESAELARTEHLVIRPKLANAVADRLDSSRQVEAEHRPPRLQQTDAEPDEERLAPKQDAIGRIDGRRVDPDEHLARCGRRPRNLLEPEHLRRAVSAVDDGLHEPAW